MKGGVLARYDDQVQGWRVYWSETLELADERVFASLEEAGPALRELVRGQEEWITIEGRRRPA